MAFIAVKIHIVVFLVTRLCRLIVGANVSEEHTASLFRAEV